MLAARADEDTAPAREACFDAVDHDGLEAFTGEVGYLDRDHAKRDYDQAVHDGAWMLKEAAARSPGLTPSPEAAIATLRADPKARARADRAVRGQVRLRAVRAAQARLVCEGFLSPAPLHAGHVRSARRTRRWPAGSARTTSSAGAFWAATRRRRCWRPRAPRSWTRSSACWPNGSPTRPAIVEDGSINLTHKKDPPTWRDAAGTAHAVPDVIGEHVQALLAALGVATPEDAVAFLRQHHAGFPTLHVAFKAPPLPAYYSDHMDLAAEIDRGDVWYDFPFDARGKPDRAAARPLPAPDAVRALERPEDPALLVAHDDRLVAQRAAGQREGLLQVQELRRRPARVEADRRDARLDPARRNAGQGPAGAPRAGSRRRAR